MIKKPIKLAVVGVGYFGSFHCQKVDSLPDTELAAVVDIDSRRGQEVASRFRTVAFTTHQDLYDRVDAAIVAVPTSVHHKVTADLLANGISVLVEKPLATTVSDADDLCKLVNGSSAHLQVGHLERFNSAFLEAVRCIKHARYIRMERSGPFPGRGGDVDVVLELMTHDLDILLQMTSGQVQSISASGWPVLTPHLDLATARIRFTDGLVADLHASRISSERSRRFSVLDQLGMLEVDLATRSITRISPDGGRQESEQKVLQSDDPLLDQDRAFVEALHNGHRPLVGAEAGRAAVVLAARILECIHAGSASC